MSTKRRRWPFSYLRQPLSAGLENSRVSSFGWLHGGLFGSGYPERALAKSREMLEVAERASNPGVLVFASYQAAYHLLEQGDSTAAQKRAEQVMSVTEELGLASISAMATTCYGAALIVQGRYEEGIAAMRPGGVHRFPRYWEEPRTSGFVFWLPGSEKLVWPQEALEVVEEGLASVAKTGEQIASPSLHHVRGELLLAQNPSDVAEAEQCFRTAIEIARRQSARSAELRATTSLARLLDEQGKRVEARAMLADIYNWFTEGFDTSDLKDAKELLDELSG